MSTWNSRRWRRRSLTSYIHDAGVEVRGDRGGGNKSRKAIRRKGGGEATESISGRQAALQEVHVCTVCPRFPRPVCPEWLQRFLDPRRRWSVFCAHSKRLRTRTWRHVCLVCRRCEMQWCARTRERPTLDICCGSARKEHTVTIDVPQASRQKLIMSVPELLPHRCVSRRAAAAGRRVAGQQRRLRLSPLPPPLHARGAAGQAAFHCPRWLHGAPCGRRFAGVCVGSVLSFPEGRVGGVLLTRRHTCAPPLRAVPPPSSTDNMFTIGSVCIDRQGFHWKGPECAGEGHPAAQILRNTLYIDFYTVNVLGRLLLRMCVRPQAAETAAARCRGRALSPRTSGGEAPETISKQSAHCERYARARALSLSIPHSHLLYLSLSLPPSLSPSLHLPLSLSPSFPLSLSPTPSLSLSLSLLRSGRPQSEKLSFGGFLPNLSDLATLKVKRNLARSVCLKDLVKIKGMSECLGKGVSGTVWKVRDRSVDETLALKEMAMDIADERKNQVKPQTLNLRIRTWPWTLQTAMFMSLWTWIADETQNQVPLRLRQQGFFNCRCT